MLLFFSFCNLICHSSTKIQVVVWDSFAQLSTAIVCLAQITIIVFFVFSDRIALNITLYILWVYIRDWRLRCNLIVSIEFRVGFLRELYADLVDIYAAYITSCWLWVHHVPGLLKAKLACVARLHLTPGRCMASVEIHFVFIHLYCWCQFFLLGIL